MASVFPLSDDGIEHFGDTLDPILTAQPTVYGATAQIATEVHSLLGDYKLKKAASLHPSTRTKGTIASKNVAKAALRAKLNHVVKLIYAQTTLSPQQIIDIGLVPHDVSPSPVPPPVTRPQLRLVSDGTLLITDELTPKRTGKAPGTRGALVNWVLLPPTAPPPSGLEQTPMAMIATRGKIIMPLPAAREEKDAKKLYVLARWFNDRGQLGPVSELASTTIAA